jgi:hypothetical protein
MQHNVTLLQAWIHEHDDVLISWVRYRSGVKRTWPASLLLDLRSYPAYTVYIEIVGQFNSKAYVPAADSRRSSLFPAGLAFIVMQGEPCVHVPMTPLRDVVMKGRCSHVC